MAHGNGHLAGWSGYGFQDGLLTFVHRLLKRQLCCHFSATKHRSNCRGSKGSEKRNPLASDFVSSPNDAGAWFAAAVPTNRLRPCYDFWLPNIGTTSVPRPVTAQTRTIDDDRKARGSQQYEYQELEIQVSSSPMEPGFKYSAIRHGCCDDINRRPNTTVQPPMMKINGRNIANNV
jgi:hypothetical protein